MTKKPNYCCPRCGYKTDRKSSMNVHFFKVKKPCPILENDIDLTDEIKNHILVNRIYIIPEKKQQPNIIQTFNQVINNYNTMNNFINQLDTIDKLTKYTDHKQIDLVSFEDSIDSKYSNRAKRLDNNMFKHGFGLNTEDLLETINDISNMCECKSLEEFNIVYDSNMDRLKIYDGTWEELLLNTGIKRIIETIQVYYWNSYEMYLLRKIHENKNSQYAQQLFELLSIYFKFIGAFNIEPYFHNKSDGDILGNESEEYEIDEEFWAKYVELRNNITKSEIAKISKDVAQIIKKNSQRNSKELNTKVLELFQMDETFKASITSFLSTST